MNDRKLVLKLYHLRGKLSIKSVIVKIIEQLIKLNKKTDYFALVSVDILLKKFKYILQ